MHPILPRWDSNGSPRKDAIYFLCLGCVLCCVLCCVSVIWDSVEMETYNYFHLHGIREKLAFYCLFAVLLLIYHLFVTEIDDKLAIKR